MRLDAIEKSVTDISTKVKSMDEKVMALGNKIGNIEQSRDFDSRSVDEMRGRHNEIDKMLKEVRKSQKALSDGENKVKEQLVDLKCREMRDNLLFYNVDEERGETDDACMEKVLGIIEDEMRIENARRDMSVHRAHRIGRFTNGKTRPIVAKFVLYPDRERVRKAGSVLREANSKYGVSQQFPKQIQDRRKALVPIMKQARNEGKDAYIMVDKLYIDKVLYRGPACPLQNMNLGGAVTADTAGASMETETGHGENAYGGEESELSVLCWNVEGLTLAKKTCADFVSLISKYDIICLIETWTTKTSQIEIDGYKTLVHSYRKFVNERAKRASEGLIIYVKNSIYKGVKLAKNEIDCIIWLKLDKIFFTSWKIFTLGQLISYLKIQLRMQFTMLICFASLRKILVVLLTRERFY